jgi:hypothetical protein
MTDDEIDSRLRAHGTAWRDANHDRPAIDWDVVTKPRRSLVWFAVAGVCVAVIAIVVPLVLTTGDSSAGKPVPPVHPSPSPSPTSAKAGAPPGFFALKGNRIAFVTWTGGRSMIRPVVGRAESLGVAADDETAYASYEVGNCRTSIYKVSGRTNLHGVIDDSERIADVVTIAGGTPESSPSRQEMAVSPDGTKLALVVSTLRADNGADNCQGPEKLVVVNLVTRGVRQWSGTKGFEYVGDLQWAPDSQHLAFAPQFCCGTRILDTAGAGSSYTHRQTVLPENARTANGARTYGPVFWWQGEMVTTLAGSLRPLNGHGGVGPAVARGFPWVDSVSSDPTGQHLLLASAQWTYRWDNGKLSRVPGRWTQPAW